MNIKVYNNRKLVYTGNIRKFLEDNDYDLDVLDMVKECVFKGKSERRFFSGKWKIIKTENNQH